jgi:hypothetical protein
MIPASTAGASQYCWAMWGKKAFRVGNHLIGEQSFLWDIQEKSIEISLKNRCKNCKKAVAAKNGPFSYKKSIKRTIRRCLRHKRAYYWPA